MHRLIVDRAIDIRTFKNTANRLGYFRGVELNDNF